MVHLELLQRQELGLVGDPDGRQEQLKVLAVEEVSELQTLKSIWYCASALWSWLWNSPSSTVFSAWIWLEHEDPGLHPLQLLAAESGRPTGRV